jgi:hypothetical protein
MRILLPKPGRSQAGMAVIVVIGLLSIILIFVAANLRTLYLLRSDLRLIERQQTNRLAHLGPITNSVPAAKLVPVDGQHRAQPNSTSK